MLELYHNAASTCSQKVRMVLAEKSLDYTSHPINLITGEQHDPAYVKLNPNHVVPTLVHDGAVFIESTLINEYLDEAFPEPPMRAADPAGRHAERLWLKHFDESVQAAVAAVTFAIGPRRMLLEQPAEVREANLAAIPDPTARPRGGKGYNRRGRYFYEKPKPIYAGRGTQKRLLPPDPTYRKTR